MCVVQYCDYGNTEQQCLSDLIPMDDREVYNLSNSKQVDLILFLAYQLMIIYISGTFLLFCKVNVFLIFLEWL